MRDLLTTAACLVAVLLLYGFHRPILAALRRFDERNVARHLEEAHDRIDRTAHFKHTLRLAEEQIEEIAEMVVPDARTGSPTTRFVFEGEQFLFRDEAEAARNEAIVAKAREFYRELPVALKQRGDGSIGRK